MLLERATTPYSVKCVDRVTSASTYWSGVPRLVWWMLTCVVEVDGNETEFVVTDNEVSVGAPHTEDDTVVNTPFEYVNGSVGGRAHR